MTYENSKKLSALGLLSRDIAILLNQCPEINPLVGRMS
jgi:hypothetical protein